MEELNLKDLFSYFLNKKLYIILITAIFLFVGIIYLGYFKTPMYQSYTTILLTKEYDSTTITNTDVLLNESLVDTYREIIKSRKVMEKVIYNLELDYDYEELNSIVNVSSVNDTEIIKITVTHKDSKLAIDIANETANVFNTEIVKLYNIQNVGIVDVAKEAEKPYNINALRNFVLFGAVGFVLSVGIIFLIYYFDTTVKSEEEVERLLELPVIGNVPHVGGKK